jgi:uncharacterized membrane protein
MNKWLITSIILTLAGLTGSLFVFYGMYDSMPEQVPTHWGASGEPDQWTPREKMLPYLLIFPAVMAAMVLLTLVLPWLSPKGFELERFRDTYFYVMMVVVALMGYMHFAVSLSYVQPKAKTIELMLGGMSLFFAALGNVMGKVQRNFFLGVRTPWTLANETVWNQTHRLTGWLWVPFGLIGCVAILCGLPILIWIGALFVVVLVPVFYSLWLYKRLEKQGKLNSSST